MLLSQVLQRKLNKHKTAPTVISRYLSPGNCKAHPMGRAVSSHQHSSTHHEQHWSNVGNCLKLTLCNTDHPPAQLPFPTMSAPFLHAKLQGGMEDGMGFVTMYHLESKQKVCQKVSFPNKKDNSKLVLSKASSEELWELAFLKVLDLYVLLHPQSSMVPCTAVRSRNWTRGFRTPIRELIHPRIM